MNLEAKAEWLALTWIHASECDPGWLHSPQTVVSTLGVRWNHPGA